jgi:septal ring factor EnvC (AmiA/AmiB activator)
VKRIAWIFIAALAACATTDPPEPQMASARAMVAQARPVAAVAAPQELARAQEKLARAESAMQHEHYGHARVLAEQAEADARLAWTLSEKARLQQALQEEKTREVPR